MNPELIAAIINFLSELAGLFANHPHIGNSAQSLTNTINAAAAGMGAAENVLQNPTPVVPVAPVAPVAPVVPVITNGPKSVGAIIAGQS